MLRVACFCLLLFSKSYTRLNGQGMHVGNDTATPIPGVGHDYIQNLSETVNPANGTVNLKMAFPVPRGRGFTMPFAFTYSSGAAQHVDFNADTANQYGPGVMTFLQGPSFRPGQTIGGGGWDDTFPYLSRVVRASDQNNWTFPVGPGCAYSNNYVFRDPTGVAHTLNMGYVGQLNSSSAGTPQPTGSSGCQGTMGPSNSYGAAGDGQVYAMFMGCPTTGDCYSGAPPVNVTDQDGTVYSFQEDSWRSAGSFVYDVPMSIEDRNGNVVSITNGIGPNAPAQIVTDTVGRRLVDQPNSSQAPSSVTISGISYPITYSPSSTTNFSISYQQLSPDPGTGWRCRFSFGQNQATSSVRSITLPNNQAVTFYYGSDNPDPGLNNPYGLISEIIYPDGGWVKYTWGINSLSEMATFPPTQIPPLQGGGVPQPPDPIGCVYEYSTPALLTRQMGIGSTPTQTQTFSYATTWANNYGWSSKTTTVYTYDHVVGKTSSTVYSYAPFDLPQPLYTTSPSIASQVATESSIAHYDWVAKKITSGSTGPLLETDTEGWYTPTQLSGSPSCFQMG